jgi:TPR repeat protein
LGVSQSYQLALYWFKRAAENDGNKVALLNIGDLYYHGFGLEQNYEKAFEYMEMSASSGCIQAMFNLGEMFYAGKGVKQDLKKARYWLEKAAYKGDEKAKERIRQLKLSASDY